jgi:hypothetical protein
MSPPSIHLLTRRNPTDHDLIVEQLLDRCKGFIESISQAPDLHNVASTEDDGAVKRRVEVAMVGVMAHIDGRWQEAKVATILVRRLEGPAEEPSLSAVLARRYVGVLGSAEDLVARITQAIREAGWERISIVEILSDGAAWIWNVAEVHFPGVR